MSFITVPFSWLLLRLYEPVQNYGFAIILFALIVKIVLLPFQMKSKRSMMRMNSLQPLVKELEKKHGGNQQKYQAEVAKLYQDEKINPMSGCLWSLIPFPILIALYSVVRAPLTNVMGLAEEQITTLASILESHGIAAGTGAYGELEIAKHIGAHFEELKAAVPELMNLNFNFLGINLCDIPQWNFFTHVDWSVTAEWAPALGLFMIPVISALATLLSTKVMQAGQAQTGAGDQQASMMKSMNLMMPIMSVYIGFIMPAAMGIYWIANSLLAMVQELVLGRHYKKVIDQEAEERGLRVQARVAEIERKREEKARLREEGELAKNKNTSKRKLEIQNKAREEERLAQEKASKKGKKEAVPASQVGRRKYARGRGYDPDRYGYAGDISSESEIDRLNYDASEDLTDDAPIMDSADFEADGSVEE